jgi:hypothetical protein
LTRLAAALLAAAALTAARAALALAAAVSAPAAAVSAPATAVSAPAAAPAAALVAPGAPAHARIVGVTLDDLGNLDAEIASLRALPVHPWVRVVLNVNRAHVTSVGGYRVGVERLSRVSSVMGELVDSSELRAVSVAEVRSRTASYVRSLSRWVSVWEVGNEVNGNWTGASSVVARKVLAAYDIVHAAGDRAALTLYDNQRCGDGPGELAPSAWSRRYLPSRVRTGMAYVWISYYEAQCRAIRPSVGDLTRLFSGLHRLFPHARVGFGEVGMPHPATARTRSAAVSLIDHYYRLRIPLSYFVGGDFWWYYAEDMVPRSKYLWGTLASAL